jgi:hypothetical protein
LGNTALEDLHPGIKAVLMPPNTDCDIQLMDQTVKATFKQYYMRRTIGQGIKITDKECGLNLKEF